MQMEKTRAEGQDLRASGKPSGMYRIQSEYLFTGLRDERDSCYHNISRNL